MMAQSQLAKISLIEAALHGDANPASSLAKDVVDATLKPSPVAPRARSAVIGRTVFGAIRER